MSKLFSIALVTSCLFFVLSVDALTIVEHQNGQDISYIFKNDEKNYKGIIGDYFGTYRGLIKINNEPGLFAFGRDDQYFTLIEKFGKLYIDCTYSDSRNTYNGARVQIAECGLDTLLDADYSFTTQTLPQKRKENIFSFDTKKIIETGKGSSFFLGNIGEIKIYDHYSSPESLEENSPDKYIWSNRGCHHFKGGSAYLVFMNASSAPLYIDVVRNKEPLKLDRLDEPALKKLAINTCSNLQKPSLH